MGEDKFRIITILAIPIIVISGGIISYKTVGWEFALVIMVALLVSLILLRPLFYRRNNIFTLRIYAIAVYVGIVFLLFQESWLLGLLNSLLSNFQMDTIPLISDIDKIVVLLISGTFLIVITRIKDNNNIIGKASPQKESSDAPFKNPDYIELRNRFCKYMISKMDKLDQETNWSDHDYTRLEAEVEVFSKSGRRGKVEKDLIKCIRKDKKSRSFLIIGDPGSGKSVSLRHLTRKLYQEVKDQGSKAVVPLYINLKEWDTSLEVTDKNIREFAKNHILEQSGRDGKKFLDKYYEKMIRNGGIFFLFDSFDELPSVLDTDDRSLEIREISNQFDILFKDIHNCRGILSSRPFRRPVGFDGRRISIRPFQERQIQNAMKNWLRAEGINPKSLILDIFINKPHLAPALRNPFMSELVAIYVIDNENRLPNSYFDLFNHYISQRLEEDLHRITRFELKIEDVREAAINIARVIFENKNIGLEISIDQLNKKLKDKYLENKINVMKYSRLVRLGGKMDNKFSFVHRRFAEFFSVEALLENPKQIDRSSIPEDSRWRDSLVVFSGVAPIEEVKNLANFAWETIIQHKTDLRSGNMITARPAVHSLRFLRDACQSRPKVIDDFKKELSDLIVSLINNEDILVAKIACEMLPLLTPEARTTGLIIAFKRNITWISETALRSCRHLAIIERNAVDAIEIYIRKIDTYQLFKNYTNLNFSFKMSDSLRTIRLFMNLDIISILLLWIINITTISFIIVNENTFPYFEICSILIIEIVMFFSKNQEYKGTQSTRVLPFVVNRPGLDTSVRLSGILMTSNLPFLDVSRLLSLIFLFSPSIYKNIVISVFKKLRNYDLDNLKDSLNDSLDDSLDELKYSLDDLKDFLNERSNKYALLIIIIVLVILYLIYYISKIYDYTQLFFYFLIGLILSYPAYLTLRLILLILINTYKDYILLKKLKIDKDEITWIKLCHTLNRFKTEWGQSKYIEIVNQLGIKISDYDENMLIKCWGTNSEIQLAMLKEKIFNIQE